MASIRPLKRKGGTKCRVFIRRKGKQPVSKVFDLKSDARKWAPVDVIDAFMLDYCGKDTAIVGRLSWWRTHYEHITLANFNQATV